MKISVILSIFNRSELLRLGLASLVTQTMSTKDFEVILVDDNSTEDLSLVYKDFPLNVTHIRFDPTSHPSYKGYHTPSLAINLGIKEASGEVLCISQPEVYHNNEDFMRGWDYARQNKEFVFGRTILSHRVFTAWARANMPCSFEMAWQEALKHGQVFPAFPEDTEGDKGLYWFNAYVRKDYAEAITGVDESYMKGVYAEDDNFRDRLKFCGVMPVLNPSIKGVHINHAYEEDIYVKQDRHASFWYKGAEYNRTKYRKFCVAIQNGEVVKVKANDTWGDPKYITSIKRQTV